MDFKNNRINLITENKTRDRLKTTQIALFTVLTQKEGSMQGLRIFDREGRDVTKKRKNQSKRFKKKLDNLYMKCEKMLIRKK